jgi:hypothetical protein
VTRKTIGLVGTQLSACFAPGEHLGVDVAIRGAVADGLNGAVDLARGDALVVDGDDVRGGNRAADRPTLRTRGGTGRAGLRRGPAPATLLWPKCTCACVTDARSPENVSV